MNPYQTQQHYSDDDLGLNLLSNSNVKKPPINSNNGYSSDDDGDAPQFSIPPPPRPSMYNPEPSSPPQTFKASYPNYQSNYDNQSDGSVVSNNSYQQDYNTSYDNESNNKKKAHLLHKLNRYRKDGIELSRSFSMHDSYEDILEEYNFIKKDKNLDTGVNWCKHALVTFTYGIEILSSSTSVVDVRLDGWSQHIDKDIQNKTYDEVLEELYDKYYDLVGDTSPELKLVMMLGLSATMYHASQKGFGQNIMKKHLAKQQLNMSGPSGDMADDILRNDLSELGLRDRDLESNSSLEAGVEKHLT